jgi:phosphatidylglycerophosphate synthase
LIREITLIVGSGFMMLIKPDFRVHPLIWGKLTTCFQSIFIMWLFLCYFCGWVPVKTFSVALVILSLFSFLALIQYLRIGFRFLKS